MLKMIRLVHILEIFNPFARLINCCMVNSEKTKREDVLMLVVLFAAAILGAHMCACTWIYLGTF